MSELPTWNGLEVLRWGRRRLLGLQSRCLWMRCDLRDTKTTMCWWKCSFQDEVWKNNVVFQLTHSRDLKPFLASQQFTYRCRPGCGAQSSGWNHSLFPPRCRGTRLRGPGQTALLYNGEQCRPFDMWHHWQRSGWMSHVGFSALRAKQFKSKSSLSSRLK